MNFRIISIGLLCCALAVFSACKKDNASSDNLRVVMTDSPVDDARVKGVFITVAEIRIDGTPMEGFTKTTFDISAYQKGATKLLTEAKLNANSYQNVTLVLDYSTTANGASPGCWVEEENGTKHPLTASSTELNLAKSFTLSNDNMTTMVLDFDLRKALRRDAGNNQNYTFVSHANLQSAVRVTVQNQTGVIKGMCDDQVTTTDKIVVYAYQKGTYNVLIERNEMGGVAFINAVSSAAVDANGNFEMHFLNPGDYELVFIAYKDLNNDGNLSLQGTFLLDVLTAHDLKSVNVSSQSSATVNVKVTGLLPI